MKKVLICLLCMVLAVGIAGCSGNYGGQSNGEQPQGEGSASPGPEGPDETVYSLGNPVDAPIEVDYLIRNPLEIGDIPVPVSPVEGDQCEYEHSIIEISGLKDAEVEARINQRMRAAYEELTIRGLPPYRGIKKALPEGAVMIREQLSAYTNANYNNVLSVTVSKYSSYSIPDRHGTLHKDDWAFTQEVTDSIWLNIDLNTGKDIPLCALFGDNTDYMTLINDALAATLAASSAEDEGWYGQWTGIWQTGPFTGLDSDLKFCISDWGGLTLIADYDTPQFYTDSYYPVEIPLGLNAALSEAFVLPQRYWSPASDLFSEGEESQRFFPQSGAGTAPLFYEERQEDGVNITAGAKCAPALPEELQALLREFAAPDPAVLSELKSLAKAPSPDGEEYTYYYTDATGNQVGPFYNLWFYAGAGSSSDQSYSFRNETYLCYDAATLEPLTLSAIFAEGFDYETLLIDRMMADLTEAYGAYAEKDVPTDPYSADVSIIEAMRQPEALRELLLQRLRENPGNFRMESDSLVYMFGGRVNDSNMDEFQWLLYNSSLWLPYSEIGYENLRIFD